MFVNPKEHIMNHLVLVVGDGDSSLFKGPPRPFQRGDNNEI